jgi:uncharacterized OB-fold protein
MSAAAGAMLPPEDAEAAPFWEGARRGELRIQRCPVTGRLIHPPRAFSPFAAGVRPEWTRVSGRGRIWSFAVIHPPLLEPFASLAPYNAILVELEEDPRIRLVGNLVERPGGGIGQVDPAGIRIGAAVRVVFEPVADAVHLPRWVLAQEEP